MEIIIIVITRRLYQFNVKQSESDNCYLTCVAVINIGVFLLFEIELVYN